MKCTPNWETRCEIAARWAIDPTNVVRTLTKYGVSGKKFGTSRQSARRYQRHEVLEVEKILGLNAGIGMAISARKEPASTAPGGTETKEGC